MKQIMIIGVLLFSVACANRKERIQERKAHEGETSEVVDQVVAEPERFIGTVVAASDVCPVLIDAQVGDKMIKMYPINLEEKFQKAGMRLKFSYTPSRAQQPENCDLDMVVVLSEVTLMR
jgi:hypothetical protein